MSIESPERNKMMTGAPVQKEFHFAGEGVWHNLTILANHIEDATKQWLSSRKLINLPAEQSTVAAAEEAEENTLQ
jgi:hypothetical protein